MPTPIRTRTCAPTHTLAYAPAGISLFIINRLERPPTLRMVMVCAGERLCFAD